MLFLTSSLLGACCGMNVKATVNFIGVDSELGFESYTEVLDIGEGLDITLNIPEGFEHDGLTVTLDGEKNVAYEVIYDDPTIEEQYRYSTAKTIKFSISKATTDFTLDIDMTKVTRKAFSLNFSSSLINDAGTYNDNNKYDSNIYAVSVDPSGLDRLTRLDTTNVLATRRVENNKVTVYYDEYVILCYVKTAQNRNFTTFYSDTNHFTNADDILSLGTINYCRYDVAMSGNNYYHIYGCGISESNSRLFYIGRIQEGFNVYEKIPTYVEPQGFVLGDEENKFSLLTNCSKYNSDLLTVKVFAPISNTEVDDFSTTDTLDKMNGQMARQLEAVGVEHNRYDRYDMYIGEDIYNDSYIEAGEKNTLPSKLYLVVESDIGETIDDIGNRLYFCLLHYEKMSSAVPHIVFSEFLESDKGKLYFEIDRETIASYIDNKIDIADGTLYKTGNGIVYITINDEWRSACNKTNSFPYAAINYRLYYDGVFRGLNDDYTFSLYILNEDGTRDYGLLDMQNYYDETVYFRIDKLFRVEEVNGQDKEVFNKNLYFDLKGKDYDSVYEEVIQSITADTNQFTGSPIEQGIIKITDPKILNGINNIKVIFPSRWHLDQYTLNIRLNVSDKNVSSSEIKFSRDIFASGESEESSGTILMTNNLEFEDSSDFVKMMAYNAERTDDISFGNGNEIYFFVTDSGLDFDLYLGDDSRKVSSTKELKDILGNNIYITYNNRNYKVYVKYQSTNIYFDSNVKVEYYGK